MESLSDLKAQLEATIERMNKITDKAATTADPQIKSSLSLEYENLKLRKVLLENKIRQKSNQISM